MTADRQFARHARLLLLAYPGHYRRRHGTEIVTTMLEMRSPGQRRPGAGEAVHLFLSGLRQRFRLPAGRPLAVVAAVLVAVTAGAFGAAAGSWAAAGTFADLPGDAAASGIVQRVAGVGGEIRSDRHASAWWHETVFAGSRFPGGWDADQGRQRLAADGWAVSALTSRDGSGTTWDEATGAPIRYPVRGHAFTATSDGLTLLVTGRVDDIPGRPADRFASVDLQISAQSTPVLLPAIVAGLLAGLAAGWLLAATVAYRLRRTPAGRRRTAAALSGLALLALAPPAIALYGNVMRAFRDQSEYGVMVVHSALVPGAYYPFGPEWQVLAFTVAGAAAAFAAVLLATPAGRPRPVEDPLRS